MGYRGTCTADHSSIYGLTQCSHQVTEGFSYGHESGRLVRNETSLDLALTFVCDDCGPLESRSSSQYCCSYILAVVTGSPMIFRH